MTVHVLRFSLDRDEMRGHAAAHSAEGVVRLEGEDVVISYTLRMATVGGAQVADLDETPERLSEALDRDVAAHGASVRIPFTAIAAVRMSGGVMRSPRLILEVCNPADLAGVPWSDGLTCTMRLARADGQRLRLWVTEAELRLARARIREDPAV